MKNLVIAVGGLVITGFGLHAFFRERKKKAAPAPAAAPPAPAAQRPESPIPDDNVPAFAPSGVK